MSADKYPSIFSKPNGEYCLYYASNIFRNTLWEISPDIPRFYLGHIQSRDEFSPIALERKYLKDYNAL